MKLSILQPNIERGHVAVNLKIIEKLIKEAKGEILILPEFVLTGSLVLDENFDVLQASQEAEACVHNLQIPKDQLVLINYLKKTSEGVVNRSSLLPTTLYQDKLHPDEPELEAGIVPGKKEQLFSFQDKRFKVIICTDMRYIDSFDLEGLDFLVFVFHYTHKHHETVMKDLKHISSKYEMPIIVSSIVSDQNIGYSGYVKGETTISLPMIEGILEVEL